MATDKKRYSFVLLDGSVLTNGIRVLVEGVNLSQFERNPVTLYMHDDWKMPIGVWENIRKEDGKILADFVPDMEDPDKEVQRLFGKIERGIIRMASAGLADLEVTDDPMYRIAGQDGVTVLKSRMREASITPIGKNHNALRLYDRDGKEMDLTSKLELSDFTNPQNNQSKMDKKLLKKLDLADTATEKEIEERIGLLLSDKEKAENDAKTEKERADGLQKQLDDQKEAEQEARKREAVELTDAAIKDGRLNAEAREDTLNLFDKDFDGTKKMLGAIPKRQSIVGKMGDNDKLLKLSEMGWDELDKSGKLHELKLADENMYNEKFKEKFGHAPGERK